MIRRWDKSKAPNGPFVLNRDCAQAQGVIAWYPFAHSGANFVCDMAGPQRHMSTTAGPSFSRGECQQPTIVLASASSQYASINSFFCQFPFAFGCWFNATNVTAANFLVCADNAANATPLYTIAARGDMAGDPIQVAQRNDATTTGAAVTTAAYLANIPNHALGVFTSDASRTPYLNGVAGSANTTNCAGGTTVTNTSIGAAVRTTIVGPMDGSISDVLIWSATTLNADIIRRLNDPGTRFEHWYPLRSRKWFSHAAGTVPFWYLHRAQQAING